MVEAARYAASCLIVAGVLVVVAHSPALGAPPQSAPQGAASSKLPLPHELPLDDYERVLFKFLFTRAYAASPNFWTHDKAIRDTGPFIGGLYYGTHPAVRIYYSPEVFNWINGGRQGEIADGGMIVKEMFPPPAALYVDPLLGTPPPVDPATGASRLDSLISAWAVMVKDRSVAKGGWFYANPAAPKIDPKSMISGQIDKAVEQSLDNYDYPFDFPSSGIAQGTCQRCHASAASEMTFSASNNILGLGGQPIRFRNDDTSRTAAYMANLQPAIRNLFVRVSPAGTNAVSPGLATEPSLVRPLRARTDQGASQESQRIVAAGLHGPGARRQRRLAANVPAAVAAPPRMPDPTFVAIFPMASATKDPKKFPGQWADHVVAGPHGSDPYITSDNCLGCHGGLGGAPYGLTMFAQTGPEYGIGYNLSEYGEWRWSPMGLAGRDPVFHSQIEGELAVLDAEFPPEKARPAKTALLNFCLSCHGAMGQRQLQQDALRGRVSEITGKPLDPNFKLEYFDLTTALDKNGLTQKNYEYHKYGNLAREGVSCTICHHIDPPDPAKVKGSGFTDIEYFLMRLTTGRYQQGPQNVLNGPFDKVAVVPMQASLDVTPKLNAYVKDSQVCGTCHAINLPNVEAPFPGEFKYLNQAETIPEFKGFSHTIEQATFLEWQNSVFADKANTREFKSCQDCHMPGSFVSADKKTVNLPQLITQIATIDDTTYPMVDNSVVPEALFVPIRDNYKRHELVGLNVFVESMFSQFDSILGVALLDPMTGPFTSVQNKTNGNVLAMDNMVRQAREATVDIAVQMLESTVPHQVIAQVTVTNKVGHRFPSGVGFRRAFLEVQATNKRDGKVLWGSGRTNSVGVILDGNEKPLPTEFLPDASTFQPHYQEIRAEDQVQIYEELTLNAKNEFNTSFIHRDSHPKDNRLLARGWLSGERLPTKSPIVKEFLVATDPEGTSVLADPDFSDQDGKGASGVDHIRYVMNLPSDFLNRGDIAVKATMYYQAIPPYFLQQRFKQAPDGEATKRLYYMASRLATKGTPIEDWKLRLVSATTEPTAKTATPP